LSAHYLLYKEAEEFNGKNVGAHYTHMRNYTR